MFLDTLRVFVEQRRPASVAPEAWLHSEEHLLRYKPSEQFPHGRPVSYRRIDDLFDSLRKAAPDLFGEDGELVLHSYRHALGTWCEANYTRTHGPPRPRSHLELGPDRQLPQGHRRPARRSPRRLRAVPARR